MHTFAVAWKSPDHIQREQNNTSPKIKQAATWFSLCLLYMNINYKYIIYYD